VDLDAVGEQTEVTHPHEAPGDDVEQEAAGELDSGKGLGLFDATVLAVLVAEGTLAFLVREDASVADGDSVGVTAEVAQDLLGSRHGGLGVDDEVLGRGAPQEETARDFTHAQAPFFQGELEGLKQLPPKHLGQP
jgi:hypothetical protein